jgi:hypothetical protein
MQMRKTLRRRTSLIAAVSALSLLIVLAASGCGDPSADDRPGDLKDATSGWDTDWSRHTVPYNELLSGGPPRDGIPSIDEPGFISPAKAEDWLADKEPVISLEVDGEAKAYPLQILIWHEIVNDEIAGRPVLVTFCPLCNAALAFDRTLDGKVYEFGTSGLLRNSDLVMYDRQTDSLWQQFTGEAIVGELAGTRLALLPSAIVSFADFREAFPDGRVLSRETGYSRDYGRNPYVGYDAMGENPFLFTGETDGRLPALVRVVAVDVDGTDIAYPFSVLEKLGVVNDDPAGMPLVVFHQSGTGSALDNTVITMSDDVGATGVFSPLVDGRTLTFVNEGEVIRDKETGSTWSILGRATGGPLAGTQLEAVSHADYFWFAWAAFKPDTIIYTPE